MQTNKFNKGFAALLGFLMCAVVIGYAEDSSVPSRLLKDQPVTLRFFGSADADLFTKELDVSFQGVLQKNFITIAGDGFPAGFVNASLPGFP
jgi:hypothetical protein